MICLYVEHPPFQRYSVSSTDDILFRDMKFGGSSFIRSELLRGISDLSMDDVKWGTDPEPLILIFSSGRS